MVQNCQNAKNAVNNEVVIPFKQWYKQLPNALTETKFEYIEDHDYNVRFNVVNGLAVLSAMLTFKKSTPYNLTSHTLRAVKNAGLVYFIAGLFIAPQIYNPLMHKKH